MADERSFWQSMKRGWAGQCPQCGTGRLFGKFLKTREDCEHCGLAIHHHRADDAPPYFTIFLVGHIVVPPLLWLERNWTLPVWAIFLGMSVVSVLLVLFFLPRIKGALIGLQWSQRMHGFGAE